MNAAKNNISVDQLLNNLKQSDQAAAQNTDEKQEGADKAAAQAALRGATMRRVEDSLQSKQSKHAAGGSTAVKRATVSSVWGKTLMKQPESRAAKKSRRGLVGIKRKSDTMAEKS